jgi:uncharacterized protein (TIGR03086 family)
VTLVNEVAARHIGVCKHFGTVLAQAAGQWSAPTPCREWDVRGVVEHVIGFHDVLLLRPLSAKPTRPRDDPEARWTVTVDALTDVFDRPGLFDSAVAVPALGGNAPTEIDAKSIVPMLTQDVLIHSWDVARAIGVDDRLDADLCARFLSQLPDDARLERSGMFGAVVDVPPTADPQSKLLGRLGRDPSWTRA